MVAGVSLVCGGIRTVVGPAQRRLPRALGQRGKNWWGRCDRLGCGTGGRHRDQSSDVAPPHRPVGELTIDHYLDCRRAAATPGARSTDLVIRRTATIHT